MNNNHLICFKFETSSSDPKAAQPLALGAVAIHPRTLEPVPGERGEFYSLMKPTNPDAVQKTALEKNRLNLAELCEAPEPGQVWGLFANWVYSFNPNGKSPLSAPIPCGKNIRLLDLPLVQRLCAGHGMVDKTGVQNLFSKVHLIDLQDYLWHWFENSSDLESFTMDVVRKYFGIAVEEKHTALTDARQVAALIMKFQHFYRRMSKSVRFKDSMTKA